MLEYGLAYGAAGRALLAASLAFVRLRWESVRTRWLPEMVFGAAMLATGGFLFWRGFRASCLPARNLCECLALLALVAGAGYLGFSRRPGVASLGLFLMPLVGVLSFGAAATVACEATESVGYGFLFLLFHVGTALLGYAALVCAAGAGLAYVIQERALRVKRFGMLSRRLPPLSVLDELGYRAIVFGFPSLSVGIMVGIVCSERTWGSPWFWEPKVTLSLVLWLLCAIAFHLRTLGNYQGRRTAILSIALGLMVPVVSLVADFVGEGRHVFL